MKIVVTGAAGFIGSHLVDFLITVKGCDVLGIDSLTYASDLSRLKSLINEEKFTFVNADICDLETIKDLFHKFKPVAVVHTAAETSVDLSIAEPSTFIQTNIFGVFQLLTAALSFYRSNDCAKDTFRFLHVSTDEVYGSAEEGVFFNETSPLKPSSPYAATKASSDLLVHSWFVTYGLPTLISNCTNNYGFGQHKEKLIPKVIDCAVNGLTIPIYGSGKNQRDWLHVKDHVDALWKILHGGTLGDRYNIGSGELISNIDVVRQIITSVKQVANTQKSKQKFLESEILHVQDRLGHDFRYAVNSSRLRSELKWKPSIAFSDGVRELVCETITTNV